MLTYGAPVLAPFLATLARLALRPLVGSAVPFVTYFSAAVLLAWYRGFWPAAWSVLLSAFAGAHYVLGGQPWSPSERVIVIAFAITSLTVSFLIDFQRKTLTRATSAEQAQAVIARENALLLKRAQQSQEDLRRSNE